MVQVGGAGADTDGHVPALGALFVDRQDGQVLCHLDLGAGDDGLQPGGGAGLAQHKPQRLPTTEVQLGAVELRDGPRGAGGFRGNCGGRGSVAGACGRFQLLPRIYGAHVRHDERICNVAEPVWTDEST